MKRSHGALEKPFQLVGRLFRQVLDLGGQSGQTFSLSSRSHSNPKVSSELQRGAQCVTFHNVGFHRNRCTTELIEKGTRARMIRGVALLQCENCGLVSLLPCEE